MQHLPETLTGENFDLQLAAGDDPPRSDCRVPGFSGICSASVSATSILRCSRTWAKNSSRNSRKRDASCTDCSVASSDAFDLTSYDVFGQFAGSDSMRNRWMINALYSHDAYVIRQDTTTALDVSNSVTSSLANAITPSPDSTITCVRQRAGIWHGPRRRAPIRPRHDGFQDQGLRSVHVHRRLQSDADDSQCGPRQKFPGHILGS